MAAVTGGGGNGSTCGGRVGNIGSGSSSSHVWSCICDGSGGDCGHGLNCVRRMCQVKILTNRGPKVMLVFVWHIEMASPHPIPVQLTSLHYRPSH